jgi:hypothetical protein
MPFPDLAAMMGQSLGIQRPPRQPLARLQPHPDPEVLPGEVLSQILMKMGAYANWATVAYGSSSGTQVGRIQAEWFKQDSRADVNEYLAQLSETQRNIAVAAFRGGLADLPPDAIPETVRLDWVAELSCAKSVWS